MLRENINMIFNKVIYVVQLVGSLIAETEVVGLISAWSHTIVEIYHVIFSMDILLLPLGSRRIGVRYKGMYVHARNTGQACPGQSMVRLSNCLNMTIAADWDVKPQTIQKLCSRLMYMYTGQGFFTVSQGQLYLFWSIRTKFLIIKS